MGAFITKPTPTSYTPYRRPHNVPQNLPPENYPYTKTKDENMKLQKILKMLEFLEEEKKLYAEYLQIMEKLNVYYPQEINYQLCKITPQEVIQLRECDYLDSMYQFFERKNTILQTNIHWGKTTLSELEENIQLHAKIAEANERLIKDSSSLS